MKLKKILSFFCFCVAALAQSGQVVVSVRDSDGAPLNGAVVSLSPLPQVGSDPAAYRSSQTTGSDGVAQFGGIPQGSFGLCVQPPFSKIVTLVDSCSWVEHPQVVSVNLLPKQSLVVQLQLAATVNITLNDRKSLLASESYPGQHSQIYIGVSRGHRHPVPLTSLVGGTRTYSIAVPVDTNLSLQAISDKFAFAAQGFSRGIHYAQSRLPFRIAKRAGGSPTNFQLSVAGSAPAQPVGVN